VEIDNLSQLSQLTNFPPPLHMANLSHDRDGMRPITLPLLNQSGRLDNPPGLGTCRELAAGCGAADKHSTSPGNQSKNISADRNRTPFYDYCLPYGKARPTSNLTDCSMSGFFRALSCLWIPRLSIPIGT